MVEAGRGLRCLTRAHKREVGSSTLPRPIQNLARQQRAFFMSVPSVRPEFLGSVTGASASFGTSITSFARTSTSSYQHEIIDETFFEGRTRAQIVKRRGISESTYDNHVQAAYRA